VVLAGSCAERTFDQLAHFAKRRPALFLDPARAAEGGPDGGSGAGLVAEPLAFAQADLAGSGPSRSPPRLGQMRLHGCRAISVAAGRLGWQKAPSREPSPPRPRRPAFRRLRRGASGAVLEALKVEALEVESYVTAGSRTP
jgi:hypothetical protein